jgi:adenylate cyclase
VLKGSINRVGSQIQVNASLLRASDNLYLWSDSFRREFNPGTMIDLRHDIAAQAARVLVQPHGVIDKAELQSTAGRPAESLSSYECVLRTREYWRQPNAEMHRQVRACLERAVQTDPDYADAWAALAFIYTDELRVDFNPSAERPDPVGTALQVARQAIALAPDNPLPLQALGIAHWLRREVPLSIGAYERALALNPHDSDILADLGRAYSLIGDWDKGIPLIREAFERNPAQPSWYRLFIALFHYMHGQYDEALAEAQRIGTPDLVYTHVVLAMIYGQTGSKDDATHEVDEVLRLYPNFGDKAVFEFERRNINPAIIAGMIDGLRKAGLDVASPHWESADEKD